MQEAYQKKNLTEIALALGMIEGALILLETEEKKKKQEIADLTASAKVSQNSIFSLK